MGYIVEIRRNSKERYWEYHVADLEAMRVLLIKMFTHSEEDEIYIRLVKEEK